MTKLGEQAHHSCNIRSTPRGHKFLVLDALRGVAAVAVILMHMGAFQHLFYHAYLAVDFFFALSAFVLSYAYQERLDHGLTTRQFLKVRIIRLYPLYIAATLSGFSLAIFHHFHAGQRNISHYLISLLMGIFFIHLPIFKGYPGSATFPFNPPAWSVFYELLANLIHGLFLRNRSTKTLILLLAAVGALFFYTLIASEGLNYGIRSADFPIAVQRVLFSYLIGMLLYRLWERKTPSFHIPMLVPTGLLVIVFTIPKMQVMTTVYFEMGMLLIVLPCILYLGTCSTAPAFLGPIASMLGLLSYGIYILQTIVIECTDIAWKFLGAAFQTSAFTASVVNLLVLFLVAWLADRYYDLPIRRWLRNKLGDRPTLRRSDPPPSGSTHRRSNTTHAAR